MRVRLYREGDAAAMTALFRRSAETIGPRHYTPAQVAAWATRAPTPEALHTRATDGRVMLVAADEADQPVAFGDLEADGHIDLLYCAPEAAGSGLVGILYATLEAIARERGVPRLYSEASEAALRFFVKRGFTMLHRRDLMIGDVPIHNYAVEKRLT